MTAISVAGAMIEFMPARNATVLLGRDAEVERVTAALGTGGQGGAVLLGGEAGIGKTALVGRVVAGAGRSRVLIGHCVGEGGTSLPYLPFVEVFGGLDADERDLVDDLVASYPGLVPLVPRLAAGARHDAVRADLVEAVHGALVDLGRRGPLLLVVEDAHWADESTRELLTVLFTRGGPGGVGILTTYRSDDVHRRHPLSPALAVWSRLPGLTRVDLGPLPDSAVRQIVGRGGAALAPRVVADVVSRAEGNAFFAEELAAATRSGTDAAEDLQRLLLARVDQLDDAAQAVVRVAAVVGRRVPHLLLERVAGVDTAVLRTALRAAVERHVLEPWADHGYQFRHALLAEAVLDDLLPHDRLHLHRACAAALVEDPTLGTDADLARHALASGDRELALTAAVRAGDAARRMGGPTEALAHYEMALCLLDPDHPDRLGGADGHEITLAAAAAANASGRPMRAGALLRARLDTGDPSPHQRAALLGGIAFAVRMTEERVDRLALTAEALELVADDAPAALRVGLLTRRAEALMDAGAASDALVVADEAMALAVEHDLRVDRTDLSSTLARLSEVAGDPGESIRRLESVVAEWRDVPDLALLRAMHVLAGVHYRQGEYDAALAGFERTWAEAGRVGLGSSVWASDARAYAITTAYEMGDWDTALRHADDALATGLPAAAAAGIEAAAGYVRAARGTASAADLLAVSRPWWGKDGRIAVQSGSAAVELLGRDGDIEGMLTVHDELVEFLRGLWGAPRVAVEVRLAAVALGQLATAARSGPPGRRAAWLDRAAALHEAAAAVWGPASALPAPTLEGRAWVTRSHAEWLRVRWAAGEQVPHDELVDAWRRTCALFEERAEPYELARSLLGCAEVLAASGHHEVSSVVERAIVLARPLGARPLLDALRVVAGRRTGAGLTAREAEVLALLAHGRSNGEVGRALFISTKTASVHVSNILAKLGASTRGEAVAMARAEGLLGDM
jgi:DNA-binding CsgD family transcriptional regulator/tetratricopeptide (TPR) repeat protein